jgi:hypothetical protein
VTRPILEAFFHAWFFLEMAVRYADLEKPPQILPSGYVALLSISVRSAVRSPGSRTVRQRFRSGFRGKERIGPSPRRREQEELTMEVMP